jgi:hypothetical protein
MGHLRLTRPAINVCGLRFNDECGLRNEEKEIDHYHCWRSE